MVHRRQLEGVTLGFGNQGDLYGNAMTWWDHATGSVWSQPLGESILGPLRGERLELLPSSLTTWAGWRDSHPGTEALDVHAWQTGFHVEDMAIVVNRGGEAVAYPVTAVARHGVVNDSVSGQPVAVVVDPADPNSWAVFSRRLDDSTVALGLTAEGLVDAATGTVFDPVLGLVRSGPLSGQSLDRLAAFTAFPEDFPTFFPSGRIWSTDQ